MFFSDDERALRDFQVERSKADNAFLAKCGTMETVRTQPRLALSRWARYTVPYLADGCLIDLMTPEGGLKREAIAVSSMNTESSVASIRRTIPPHEFPPVVREVLESGVGRILEATEDPSLLGFLLPIPARTIMMLPLAIRGNTAGLVTWVLGQGDREFTKDRLGFAGEIAERIAARLANVRAYRDTQNALVAREEFVSEAGHELKGPLTALKLQVQMLQRLLPESDDEMIAVKPIRKMARRLDLAASEMADSINRLLDLTQIRSGQIELHTEAFDLKDAVVAVLDRASLAAEAESCYLKSDLESGVIGQWDRFRLTQVFSNLLSNAFKYAGGNPVEVSLRVLDGKAVYAVKDHGKGIPEVDRQDIFERFGRVRETRNKPGLGLGLYICKKITELHGGRIWVESDQGTGATFKVELPIILEYD